MAVTTKAFRTEKTKALTRKLKQQQRNASTVLKRIKKLERQLWEIKLDQLKDDGTLSKLTWKFSTRIELFNVTAVGITSKQTTKNSKLVKKLQEWSWEQEKPGKIENIITLQIPQKKGWIGMTFLFEDSMTGFDERDPMTINIFADPESNTEEQATQMISDFCKKWEITVKEEE